VIVITIISRMIIKKYIHIILEHFLVTLKNRRHIAIISSAILMTIDTLSCTCWFPVSIRRFALYFHREISLIADYSRGETRSVNRQKSRSSLAFIVWVLTVTKSRRKTVYLEHKWASRSKACIWDSVSRFWLSIAEIEPIIQFSDISE